MVDFVRVLPLAKLWVIAWLVLQHFDAFAAARVGFAVLCHGIELSHLVLQPRQHETQPKTNIEVSSGCSPGFFLTIVNTQFLRIRNISFPILFQDPDQEDHSYLIHGTGQNYSTAIITNHEQHAEQEQRNK